MVVPMITVSELAAQAGVSPQTVYRKLNGLTPHFKNNLTEKRAGILYFKDLSVAMETLGLTPCLTPLNDVKHDVKQFNTLLNDENTFLREQNATLQAELSKQAQRYASLAEQLAELTRNNQILLGAEQSRTNPALLPVEKKRGILSRIFNRRREL
jgi:DNA-binding transcriptional MerR regulator